MKIYLAPMEGVVNHHLRAIYAKIGGIDLYVSEFVRVSEQVLPRKVFIKHSPELLSCIQQSRYSPPEGQEGWVDAKQNTRQDQVIPPYHTRIQLLGSKADIIAANAKKVAALGAPGIDLNFGCPAKTVNRNKGGACLLDDSQLVGEIVRKTRLAVPQDIPVTAKIRLGYEDRLSYLDNAIAICEAGASELVVHARSKADGYKPPAYWDYIAKIKDAVNIPVIANGEIWQVEDYWRCREQSNCDDVMIGRGLMAQPDLALAIKHSVQGKPYEPLSWQKISHILEGFFIRSCEDYPNKFLGNRLKQWLHYLKMQYPQAIALFDKIKRSRDKLFILQALNESSLS